MNKGLNLASGEIIGFLNSGDTYNINSLNLVNKYFLNNNNDFLFGSVKKYKILHGYKPKLLNGVLDFIPPILLVFLLKPINIKY